MAVKVCSRTRRPVDEAEAVSSPVVPMRSCCLFISAA